MTENTIKTADDSLLKVYNRFPVSLKRGEGVYLYDEEGKEYLDFFAGIGVCALGYGDKRYTDALKEQIDLLMHTSNLFYNEKNALAAEKLKKISGMDRVFFTNSGTEAIEGLIKTARKHAYLKDGHTDHNIIAMEHSFHGRSMGALSVTGNPHYREAFEPLIGGVRFAKFNDTDSVKALVDDKTCAILLETVQGEGGVYPAEQEFLEELRRLCDERDILLMFDEIQCGMGRSGDYFAWQGYGVKPDCMALAKAIGNGIPVGAFLMTQKVADSSLVPGDHGTTYGGNPLACAAVNAVLDVFEQDDIIAHVKKVSPYLEKKLLQLKDEFPGLIADVRGRGLIRGIELKIPVGEVVSESRQMGLLVISAEGNVLRLLPPLVTEEKHIDKAVEILQNILEKKAK